MFRDAWFIARKEVQYWMREREIWFWVFLMPIVFFYFIGTVTGGFGSQGDGKDTIAVWIPDDAGFLAQQIERRLKDNDFNVVRVKNKEKFLEYRRRLTLPAGMTQTVLDGKQAQLQFASKKSGLGQDFDQLRIGRAIYTTLADVIASVESGDQPTPESLERLNNMKRSLTLKVEPAGERKTIPTGFEQAIPGTLVMFVLMNVLTSGAVTLIVDRNQGRLRRLASTPISRGEIVLGKWLARMILGIIQIAVGLLVGTFLFKMDWGPAFPMVVVVLISWASLCASFGLLVGCLARTEGQAVGLSILCAMVLAALGGCWWPIEITPDWMQAMQKFLPTGWTMDAMHKLISFRQPATSTLPHVTAMLCGALFFGWIGARVFRFQ